MIKPFSSLLFLPYLAKISRFTLWMAFLYAAPPIVPRYDNTSAGITGNTTCSHKIINSISQVEKKKGSTDLNLLDLI